MKEELLGLSVIEEFTVKCGSCGSPLANLVVSETNESRVLRSLTPLYSQYKITDCYKCGKASFDTKIFEGTISICPAKEFIDLDSNDTDIENGVIKSTLSIKKRT